MMRRGAPADISHRPLEQLFLIPAPHFLLCNVEEGDTFIHHSAARLLSTAPLHFLREAGIQLNDNGGLTKSLKSESHSTACRSHLCTSDALGDSDCSLVYLGINFQILDGAAFLSGAHAPVLSA